MPRLNTWPAYAANDHNLQTNGSNHDLCRLAEKHEFTFRLRRHGMGHWMLECRATDDADGMVEVVFDEDEDLTWPLKKGIQLLVESMEAKHG